MGTNLVLILEKIKKLAEKSHMDLITRGFEKDGEKFVLIGDREITNDEGKFPVCAVSLSGLKNYNAKLRNRVIKDRVERAVVSIRHLIADAVRTKAEV